METAVSTLPPPAAAAASDSIGAAFGVAAKLGEAGAGLAAAARSAFVDAMSVSMLVAVGVALFGAILALLFLPARPGARADAEGQSARFEHPEAFAAEPETINVTG
jgi:DHA2 family integral membrane protein (MFS transporter)